MSAINSHNLELNGKVNNPQHDNSRYPQLKYGLSSFTAQPVKRY